MYLEGMDFINQIGHGAYEVNPVMANVLDVSPSAFVASKYSLTCIATLIVLVLRNVDGFAKSRKLPGTSL
jgi:hypothetical protein